MTNQEILAKAIEKAELNRWSIPNGSSTYSYEILDDGMLRYSFDQYIGFKEWAFSHDFAKALWGEPSKWWIAPLGKPFQDYILVDTKPVNDGTVIYHEGNGWRYHLQEMVIADDPIQYLGEHLPI